MSVAIEAASLSSSTRAFVTAATQIVGPANVLTSEQDRRLYSTDFSEIELAIAAAVVRPRNSEEVVALVQLANAHQVSLTPRGGGMSYTLTYVPSRDGVVMLDMAAMNRILEIDTADLRITVEAGVTWQQIHEALRPTGFRIPFLGTFSGERATVGGGLGNNATGHGALDITDYLLGMEVVLPDGRVLQTGARAHDPDAPIVRGYGPDFTGLFTHDAGAFGVKTKASFRLVRRGAGTAYRAFGFRHESQLIDAMCATMRLGAATEILSFGDYHHRVFATQPKPPAAEARAFASAVVNGASSKLRGLAHLATLARGMDYLLQWPYSLSITVDNVSQRGAEDGARLVTRTIESLGGHRIRPSLGIVLRAQPFVPIGALMVGMDGASSFPSNFTVPLSRAQELAAAAREFFAENAAGMQQHGVYTATLFLSFKGAFGMEPIIYWPDRLNQLRESTALPAMRELLAKMPARPQSRAYAVDLRRRLVARLQVLRPAHYQTGKFYPLQQALSGHAGWQVLTEFKNQVDPQGRMNPGALGLPSDPAPGAQKR
jgi:FAD/FMN-containing dehydrogenase